MRFGAREVMVIAALVFGIVAAGCSSPMVNLAMDPHVRVMNTGADDFKICFSKHEFEFYNPGCELPSKERVPYWDVPKPAAPVAAVKPEPVKVKPKENPEPVKVTSKVKPRSVPKSSWKPSLPSFFK